MKTVSILRRTPNSSIMRILLMMVILTIIIDSVLMSRICVAMMFIACLLLGLREKNFINPYFLFSITPLTLACYVGLSDRYMYDLINKTWVLGAINILAFILALYFTKPFKTKKNCIGVKDNKRLVKHAIILYVLSELAIIIEPLASILWLFRIPAIVCAIKTKEKKMWLLVLAFMAFNMASGQMSKTGVLIDVLTILICYVKYYQITKKDWKKVAVLILAGVILMFFSFSFARKGKEKSSSDDRDEYVASMMERGNFSVTIGSAFFLPYMYLEQAWTNLDYVLHTQDKRTNGLWTLKPLLGYIGMDDDYKKAYELEANSSFNTFTFITPGFKDYGFWLSIIVPLLLGFYVKKVYTRYLISGSPFDIACYITVSLATIEMFFSNHFLKESYPITIFILMEIYKRVVVAMKDNKLELESM